MANDALFLVLDCRIYGVFRVLDMLPAVAPYPRKATRRMLGIRRYIDSPAIRQIFVFFGLAAWAEHSVDTLAVWA